MRRLRNIPFVALLLAFVLVLAACSSDDADEGATTTVADGATTTTGGDTGTTQPDGEERVLSVVLNEDPVAFNPFPETAGVGPVPSIMFPNILEFDDDNNVTSQLVESWEISEDAQTVTLHVREGAEWSDGTPVTSADILMSLELSLDSRISARATRIGNVVGMEALAEGEAEEISGLAAPDEYTVTVQLQTPDVAWIPNLASLARLVPTLPAHILGDVPNEDIPGHPFFEELSVGAGPYLFVEHVAGQYSEMVANDNWWKGEPGFDRLFIKTITGGTDAMAAQLEAGEIQFMTGLPALDAERVGSIENITIDSGDGVAADMFQLSWDDPLLQDPNIRKAMLYAINREGICQEALLGFCSVPLANTRPVGLEWAVPTDVEEFPYDPDKARELLAEAGWVDGTQMTFLHRPGIRAQDIAVTIAQANLADVGIDMVVENVDVPTLLDRLRTEDVRDSTQFWMNAGANFAMDPSAVQPYASCNTMFPNGPNLSWFCRDDVDALWAEGRSTVDQDARGEIYQEAFRILNQDPNELYIFIADNIVAYDSHIQGIRPQGDVWNQYWNIGDWYWEE